jgi:hypothetical protein
LQAGCRPRQRGGALKEKALATAKIMTIEETQKDIFVSRVDKTVDGLLIAQVEIKGEILFIYQII